MPQNYYKSNRIQKKLPKLKDEQFEFTGMRVNSHFLICGGTGTGKTNALYSYLLETSRPNKGTFKHIFVVYKTEEPLYEDLKEQLGKGISFYKSNLSPIYHLLTSFKMLLLMILNINT